MDAAVPLPMFPMAGVVFPATGVPLHLFEPRYLRLLGDLSSNPPYFGAVLITRGSEVGGGDERAEIGTLVRVSEKVRLGNGAWVVLVAGESRIRIRTWLPDDPYPVALVDEITEEEWEPDSTQMLRQLERRLRYALLLKDELSVADSASPTIALSSRPLDALWQMCAVAPVSLVDQLSLLSEDSAENRAILLHHALDQAISMFESQLSLG